MTWNLRKQRAQKAASLLYSTQGHLHCRGAMYFNARVNWGGNGRSSIHIEPADIKARADLYR